MPGLSSKTAASQRIFGSNARAYAGIEIGIPTPSAMRIFGSSRGGNSSRVIRGALSPKREVRRADAGLLDREQQALRARLDRIGQQPDDRSGRRQSGPPTAATVSKPLAELGRAHARHRGHRRGSGEAQSGQRRAHPDLALQPRIDIGVAGAVLAAGRSGRLRVWPGDGCHGGAAISRSTPQPPPCGVVVVGGDHQGAASAARFGPAPPAHRRAPR